MKKGAFTLVELIVVISLLAILGTLAFISLAGYSVDARNAKRISDLNNVNKALQLKLIDGEYLKNLVSGDLAKISPRADKDYLNITIGGMTGSTLLDQHYFAGDVNYNKLGLNKEDFSDPITGDSFKIGVTTHLNKYEIAATFEAGVEEYSIIKGNWLARNNTDTRVNTGGSVNGKVYKADGDVSDSGLVIGDYVRVGGNSEVFKVVYLRGNEVLVDKDLPITDNNSLFLNTNETDHLIRKWNSDFHIRNEKESESRNESYKDTPYQIHGLNN